MYINTSACTCTPCKMLINYVICLVHMHIPQNSNLQTFLVIAGDVVNQVWSVWAVCGMLWVVNFSPLCRLVKQHSPKVSNTIAWACTCTHCVMLTDVVHNLLDAHSYSLIFLFVVFHKLIKWLKNLYLVTVWYNAWKFTLSTYSLFIKFLH